MKIKNLMSESSGLVIKDLLVIRNKYLKQISNLQEDFVYEFEGRDSELVPILKQFKNLEGQIESYLKKKGVL